MTSQSASDTPAAGVPLELAQDRAARVSQVRYDLSFVVPEAATEPVAGRATIRFVLKDASRMLALDFAGPGERVSRLAVNGADVPVRWANEHLLLPPSSLKGGENSVELAFQAGDASLNRNPEFMYTLFVPARAHLALRALRPATLTHRHRHVVTVGMRCAPGRGTRRSRPSDRSGAPPERRLRNRLLLCPFRFSGGAWWANNCGADCVYML